MFFNKREFSSAIIHGVLTHSLPQRISGLKVVENQHNVFNQREREREREGFPLQLFIEFWLIHFPREYWDLR